MIRTLFLGVVASAGALTGVWLSDRQAPTEVVRAEVNQPVMPGGIMYVNYVLNRFKQCDREITREIIDGERVRHALGKQDGPITGKLGYDTYVQTVHIPATVAPGIGEYRVTIQDRCNPVHYLWPITKQRTIEILIASPLP